MTAPVQGPIKTAAEHPRFSGAEAPEAPPVKRIDTTAARERIAAARDKEAKAASDKPPTRRRTKEETAPSAPLPYTNGMFKAPITLFYVQAGKVTSYASQPIGQAIIGQAEVCGTAWDAVAKQNPKVRKWLLSLTQTGAVGELIFAHLPIFMAALVAYSPTFRERMASGIADSIDQMSE